MALTKISKQSLNHDREEASCCWESQDGIIFFFLQSLALISLHLWDVKWNVTCARFDKLARHLGLFLSF